MEHFRLSGTPRRPEKRWAQRAAPVMALDTAAPATAPATAPTTAPSSMAHAPNTAPSTTPGVRARAVSSNAVSSADSTATAAPSALRAAPSAMSAVPSTVDVIWLRGDEVSLTPPRREGGAMLSGNKGGKRKVKVAFEETATRPLQRRRRAMP